MDKIHCTKKVTETDILDQSFSSLKEAVTSAVGKAVCPHSQSKKKLVYEWSDKLLVFFLDGQGWNCNFSSKLHLRSRFN